MSRTPPCLPPSRAICLRYVEKTAGLRGDNIVYNRDIGDDDEEEEEEIVCSARVTPGLRGAPAQRVID